jgi:ribosomal protein S18 acetylase RimI-like enzyme
MQMERLDECLSMTNRLSPVAVLTETDWHLVRLHGHVEVVVGVTVLRVPDNPGYRWGNCLHLPAPPRVDELQDLVELSRELFGDQPESRHVMLRWDGEGIDADLVAAAKDRQMQADSGRVMHAVDLLEVSAPGVSVRPLDLGREWADIVELNIACDPEEPDGLADYMAFKQGLRRAWQAWAATGDALWWGAFIDGTLVGQAGLVCCPGGRGRFQSIETHPDYRGRGVCSSLVSTMGRHAIDALGCQTLWMGVNPKGQAQHLYAKLGFEFGGLQNSLALIEPMRVPERA